MDKKRVKYIQPEREIFYINDWPWEIIKLTITPYATEIVIGRNDILGIPQEKLLSSGGYEEFEEVSIDEAMKYIRAEASRYGGNIALEKALEILTEIQKPH